MTEKDLAVIMGRYIAQRETVVDCRRDIPLLVSEIQRLMKENVELNSVERRVDNIP